MNTYHHEYIIGGRSVGCVTAAGLQVENSRAKWNSSPAPTRRLPASVFTLDLQLIGIQGLRVVDASVVPLVPSCNIHSINAPTVMVARRRPTTSSNACRPVSARI